MNYKSFRRFLIGTIVLFYSTKPLAQTQTSAAVGAYPSGSPIPKSVFSSLPGVGVYVRDVVFEAKYTVVSYTLKLADDEGNLKQVLCHGSAFSSLAKQCINDYARPGDVISIENIKARDGGGREVKLPSLLYYIE